MKCCEIPVKWDTATCTETKYGYSNCKHPYLSQGIQE